MRHFRIDCVVSKTGNANPRGVWYGVGTYRDATRLVLVASLLGISKAPVAYLATGALALRSHTGIRQIRDNLSVGDVKELAGENLIVVLGQDLKFAVY